MTCKSCEERRQKLRDAILAGKIAEAAGHAVKGASEMVGIKAKEPENGLDWNEPAELGGGNEGTDAGRVPRKRSRFGRRDDENST